MAPAYTLDGMSRLTMTLPVHEERDLMATFLHTSTLATSPEKVHRWHTRSGALQRLTPPWEDLRVVEHTGGLEPGSRAVLELRKGPITLRWHARHEKLEGGYGFVDVQEKGPFARWEHQHRFLPSAEGGCLMEDRISYELPCEPASRWLGGRRVARELERAFTYRHGVVARDLERHRLLEDEDPLRIAVTGASGLVGSRLVPFLAAGGHEVLRLVRRQPKAADEIRWDPESGEVDIDALDGVDAVIHLAGESIASGRWTETRKRRIRSSRVDGTRTISQAVAGMQRPPRVLISASAIGYYGDRGDTTVDEDSEPGDDFLADVCVAWEDETRPAIDAGVRVVNPRIGIVLAADGGALAAMLPAFRLGAGGRVGSGKQWMSWIAIDDLIGILYHCLADESCSGPINAVSPSPVTNRELTSTLASVIHRPSVLPLPAFAVRTLLGEMGDQLLLTSTRVRPARLEATSFEFQHPVLEDALRVELGQRQP